MGTNSVELTIGRRVRIGEDYATILFIGEVAGTSGKWLGVEWDNVEKRGKHSGEKNGVAYFTCRIPNSGSFLRLNTPGLTTGADFNAALLEKYVDDLRTNGQESVVLGSSNGAIIVEVPRMDGVRARVSQIERLRRISLNNYDVAIPGDPDTTSKLCRSVQSLDLSQTLLGNWHDVADIIRQMPSLTFLELNLNRLRLNSPLETHSFPKLTHLRLNSTLINWAEACEVLVYLPELQDLQLGYNGLRRLTQPSAIDTTTALPSLVALNLDSNVLDDWVSIIQTCATITKLYSLMLPSNVLSSIPRCSGGPNTTKPLPSLHQLSIVDNPIANWSDVDSLAIWLPHLKDLSVSFEPLKLSGSSGSSSRDFVISRMPELTRLNGTEVTERERSDAELFYLSWISKNEAGHDQDIEALHPRWKELSDKYQTSREIPKPTVQNLGSSMITVNVVRLQVPVAKGQNVHFTGNSDTLRVLPTMSTKIFGMKLKKTMKIQTQIDPQALWLLSPSGSNEANVLRCFDGDLLREIVWSGVEDGCLIGLASN